MSVPEFDLTVCEGCRFYDTRFEDEPCRSCKNASRYEQAESCPNSFFRTKYEKGISDLFRRQIEKGLNKYGQTLEDNVTLTTAQRIEHLEEELADGMMYIEHLKEAISGNGLTADDYQRAALRTAGTEDMDELLLNGVMGLCGEAGEVIDLVKKARFQGHELDREKMILEAGDCAWYLSIIAHALGADLSEVLEKNIAKLKDRYPEGFDKARSINRAEKEGVS